MKKALLIISLFITSNSFGEEQQKSDPESPHSSGEIAYEVGMGVASAAAAGVSAAHGNIPGAIVGVATGAKNFISAAKKYNENVQYEKDCQRDSDNAQDRENDSDSWDREY